MSPTILKDFSGFESLVSAMKQNGSTSCSTSNVTASFVKFYSSSWNLQQSIDSNSNKMLTKIGRQSQPFSLNSRIE